MRREQSSSVSKLQFHCTWLSKYLQSRTQHALLGWGGWGEQAVGYQNRCMLEHDELIATP